jgi:hypothetical protein
MLGDLGPQCDSSIKITKIAIVADTEIATITGTAIKVI